MQENPLSNLTAIVLTFNEAIHIERCIHSLRSIASRIVIVDSFSTDDTVSLALKLGAEVYTHDFLNHSAQLNWALDNVSVRTEWVMRLDADEYLTEELQQHLPSFLATALPGVAAFTINLRRIFLGRWLKFGSLYPIRMLRVWRVGAGRCETRWMDEHVAVTGTITHIDLDFVDHSLQPLTWWTNKHNGYASREAVEFLNERYGFMQNEAREYRNVARDSAVKGFLKRHLYNKCPLGLRALVYFIYRYLFRLGFLDGKAGLIFHVLQGFWYRFLVDVKIAEVEHAMRELHLRPEEAIAVKLGIHLNGARGTTHQ